jgi:hypothetical protein
MSELVIPSEATREERPRNEVEGLFIKAQSRSLDVVRKLTPLGMTSSLVRKNGTRTKQENRPEPQWPRPIESVEIRSTA